MGSTQGLLEKIKQAKKSINTASTAEKNKALSLMADYLEASTDAILTANAEDMTAAKGHISDVMLDRLYLDVNRIKDMATGIRQVIALPDPVGDILEVSHLENGLEIIKKRVALGVIGIIYESRPNVTSDAAALAIKSGNAVVLRSGIVHVYVDKDADQEMALEIIDNAKTSRPSVCNAMEVCLVHKEIASQFLSTLEERLVTVRKARGVVPVQLRLDETARSFISGEIAEPSDFDSEFSDYIMAVKVVDSLEEAITHIEQHSTHHSDAIITNNATSAAIFTEQVDSAAVYVNASTRFTDGGEFGLGCEMGISTQKLHARGPMGLKELTSYKYVVQGSGQIRE